MSHEAPEIGDDVLSPVTEEQKATLLSDVQMPAAIIRATDEYTPPNAVDWRVGPCCDELEGPFYSEEELAILPVECRMCAGLPYADLTCGAAGLLHGDRVYIFIVEFHYRNDATRHMWGDPASVEEDIKTTMKEQDRAIKRAFAAALPKLDEIGGTAEMQFQEYMQPNGKSTDDRHVLYLFVPIAYVLENFKNSDELVAWLRRLIK
jgi:hypothetical protein